MSRKIVWLGATMLASGMPAPLFAACSPSPSVAGATTTCTGTDASGLTLDTSGSTVAVQAGATVTSPGGGTAAITATSNRESFADTATIRVAGTVDGGADAGIVADVAAGQLVRQSVPRLAITVDAGGVVTGTSGILHRSGQFTVDNSGTITASAGPAIADSMTTSLSGIYSLVNRAGGRIDGVAAPFSSIVNAGVIDGGAGTAIIAADVDFPPAGNGRPAIANGGTISNAGTAATVRFESDGMLAGNGQNYGNAGGSIDNSGTISNAGTGAAIQATELLLTNQTGATISTGGAVAVEADALQLVNHGTIAGSVTVGDGSSFYFPNSIDSTTGTITGNLTLGAGDDLVVAAYRNAAIVTGVAGTIDAGGGANTFRVGFDADATLSGALPMPASFQTLALAPAAGATVTLARGFVAPANLGLAGGGTVVNQTALTVSTIALTSDTPTLLNTGTIEAAPTAITTRAIEVFTLDNRGRIEIDATNIRSDTIEAAAGIVAYRLSNSGTIDVTGGNGFSGDGTNSGTIIASGTAVINQGAFENDGTIRSTGGVGVGGYGGGLVNRGLIEGAAIGSATSTDNYGEIRSAGFGVALTSGGNVINRVTGVISGAARAISATGTIVIDNYGVIDGSVRLSGDYGTVIAEVGSAIHGDLDLGSGRTTFVTTTANGGPGALAGVDGAITGTGEHTLLFRVTGDERATLAAPSPFTTIGFQVADGAHVTVTGGDFARPIVFRAIEFSGALENGTADLTANLAQSDHNAISTDISLTTRGTVAFDYSGTLDASAPVYGAINAAPSTGSANLPTVVNAGTIRVTDATAPTASRFAGVHGGHLINAGTIALTDAIGSADTVQVDNRGTIAAISAGDTSSRGLVGVSYAVNSGTIDTPSDAVSLARLLEPVSFSNSGTIRSRGGVTVFAPINQAAITNTATGTIVADTGAAIVLQTGGTVVNGGLIEGDVAIATRAYVYNGADNGSPGFGDPPSAGSAVHTGFIPIGGPTDAATTVHNTGTITGAVRTYTGADRLENGGSIGGASALGAGDDTYVSLAGDQVTRGLSGTVDGGDGLDTIELRATDGTAAAPVPFRADRFANFERLVEAEGVSAYSGDVAYQQVAVDGGLLRGLPGSTLTAPQGIAVAPGATLSSAGRVVGNVAVAGTLTPGDPAATLTVSGNVAFLPGSIAAFTITPVGNDRLDATGTVSINGATLALSGSTGQATGRTITLITAGGGVTGSFGTVTRTPGLIGFVSQDGATIRFTSAFATIAGDAPAARGVGYLNAVLIAGEASPALLAAAPALEAGGVSNPAAFARLTPEPYASASRIGVADGFLLARLFRGGAADGFGDEPHAFGFGQGFGDWTHLDASGRRGTAGTSISTAGGLGGIGYGMAALSLGVFVGDIRDYQAVGTLGATTHANGVVAGLAGKFTEERLELRATLAYVGTHATTRRTAPDGVAANGRYRLHALVADATASYAIPVGRAWSLTPAVSVLYAGVDRGRAAETGGSAFALDVRGANRSTTAIDGTVTIAGNRGATVRLTPWASAGVRCVASGRYEFASAGFAGTDMSFAVPGAAIARTQALVGAGAAYTIGRVRLDAAYHGSFAGSTRINAVTGGVTVAF